MNEFIYKLNANIFNSNPPEFIFIFDKSGSMGDNYNFIISKTIPEVLNSLGYQNRNIQLITFESSINYLSISQSELSKSNDRCGGQTYMSNCYKLLDKIFEISKEKCKHLRILVITDGEHHDQGRRQPKKWGIFI
jgi:Mg-chelatase subunit ChlD